MAAAQLDVLRVFVGAGRRRRNLLGVFLDAGQSRPGPNSRSPPSSGTARRCSCTTAPRLGCGSSRRRVELPLAGHPLVGTSWLLHREGPPPAVLRPPAGEVPTWQDSGLTWIRAAPEDAPPFDLVQLDSAAAIEALDGVSGRGRQDRRVGVGGRAGRGDAGARVPPGPRRSRGRGDGVGCAPPVRACGPPGRDPSGRGSVIQARPAADGRVDLGGRVTPA